jgi:hypothetical protein
LSPRQAPGEKLGFYGKWRVKEYAEVDQHGQVQLLANREPGWMPVDESTVLGVTLADLQAIVDGSGFRQA